MLTAPVRGREEIERTLSFLIDYSVRHFRDEEELQKKYNFPHFARHRQEHIIFKKQVLRLAGRLRAYL